MPWVLDWLCTLNASIKFFKSALGFLCCSHKTCDIYHLIYTGGLVKGTSNRGCSYISDCYFSILCETGRWMKLQLKRGFGVYEILAAPTFNSLFSSLRIMKKILFFLGFLLTVKNGGDVLKMFFRRQRCRKIFF